MPGCRCARRPRCNARFNPAGSRAAPPSSSTWRPARCSRRSAIRGRRRPTCSRVRPLRPARRLPSVCSIGRGTGCIRRARRSSCWSPPPRFARRRPTSTKRSPASDCRTAGSATTCADRRGRFATIRWTRPPHGSVDLHRGLVVSCNAYFAQLALHLGPQPLLDAASLFQIDVSQPPTAAGAASHARAGRLRAGTGGGVAGEDGAGRGRDCEAGAGAASALDDRRRSAARRSRNCCRPRTRRCWLATCARSSRPAPDSLWRPTSTPIAGKTGTAEVDNGRAHSWFAGFAPYGAGPASTQDCVRRRHRERRLRCACRRPGRRRSGERRPRARVIQ